MPVLDPSELLLADILDYDKVAILNVDVALATFDN